MARIAVVILFFFIVFHHNPSFSVLGPNIIVGHETRPKQVDVNGSLLRVILTIFTDSTWTRHKTIRPLVCLSRKQKSLHAISELGRASVIVHPLSAHLQYTTPKTPN